MKFKVTGQRILVKPDNLETEVKEIPGFEIVRPGDQARAERNATDRGVVVQVSPIAFKDIGDGTAWCKEGDYIVYAKHAGKWIEDPKTTEKFYLIRDEDVQGVIEKE